MSTWTTRCTLGDTFTRSPQTYQLAHVEFFVYKNVGFKLLSLSQNKYIVYILPNIEHKLYQQSLLYAKDLSYSVTYNQQIAWN